MASKSGVWTGGGPLRHVLRGVVIAAGLAAGASGALARQSSIVIDANSGAVVHAEQADASRYPASLTKVMTLYLLFEQIEAGRLNMNSRLRVSTLAASQPPTKLGLRPGGTIRVEDAIMALITRSANDVAVVVAENIAGSQGAFAERMTRRARQIGMSRTTFRNASGLPDPEQRTTARDMALLGRAIYERFPAYSRFFSRHSFEYAGRGIRNHNRLLGRVPGIDGIKTGYTRASGFNLITSARANGRHLVAVVMGGATGASRDARMAALVRRHFPQMAARRTDFSLARRLRAPQAETVVAMREEADAPEAAPVPAAQRVAAARPAIVPVPAPTPVTSPVATEPSAPTQPSPAQLASVRATEAAAEAVPAVREQVRVAAASAAGPVLQWRTGLQPVRGTEATLTSANAPAPRTIADVIAASSSAPAPAPVQVAAAAPAVPPAPPVQRQTASAPAATGWVVQIAATNSQSDAQRMLREARESVGRRLRGAQPVTEAVNRGGTTLYRARFAGFEDRRDAEAACAVLKRNDYDCMAIRL